MPEMPPEVRLAYEQARRKQPKHAQPLPDWDTLPIELREAFIYVYYLGRLDGVREAREVAEWPKAVTPKTEDHDQPDKQDPSPN
jgi:hypothetical protein